MFTSKTAALPRIGRTRTRSWKALLSVVARFLQIRRERAKLAQLDDAQLKDIGISPEEAKNEARRSSWDAPSRWTL